MSEYFIVHNVGEAVSGSPACVVGSVATCVLALRPDPGAGRLAGRWHHPHPSNPRVTGDVGRSRPREGVSGGLEMLRFLSPPASRAAFLVTIVL